MAQENPNAKRIISSGNVELDSRMGGGLPAGSLVLVEGGSGSGKSVLTQQIIFGALKDRYRVGLFTSENSVKSLISQMQSIDLDILDFLLLGKIGIYAMALARLGNHAPQALMRAIQRETNRDIIVIDSFTSAVANASSDMQILNFFESCKRLSSNGLTLIITLHSDAVEADLLNPLRSMCDAHLQLQSEEDGQRLVKTLRVAKVRGAASVTGAIVGFDVEPGWGMRVIPISKARG